jgi:alpha-1,2-mannosyltransferase
VSFRQLYSRALGHGVMRSGTGLTLSEARGHARLFAAIGWIGVVVFLVVSSGDFVHFYTIGHLAATRNVTPLYDGVAQHAEQVALVPDSASDRFLPVYPPQTALLFAPFSYLPYHWAASAWAAFTLLAYLSAVWLAWDRAALPDTQLVLTAAMAWPPLWLLVATGQTTALPLLAFVLGWWALERDRPWLGGAALGLLAFKPQFGLVIGVVAMAMGYWRVILGGLCSVALQLGLVALWLGQSVLGTYATQTLSSLPQVQTMLEPKPYLQHSLTVLTRLAGRLSLPLWLMLSLAILVGTWRVWRVQASWRVKMGVLVLASVLVNPHVYVYDMTILVLPVLWIGGWLEAREPAPWFWHAVYALGVVCLIPTAPLLWVQASVLIMGYLFWQVTRLAAPS